MKGRRMRARVMLGALLPLALLAGACGGDDDDATPEATTPASGGAAETTVPLPTTDPDDVIDADPAGVLRIGADLATVGFDMDPRKSPSPADFKVQALVYGTLLTKRQDGSYEPELAESVTVVDPQTIEVVLREGLVFSDGTPLDAEAVKASIEAIKASDNTRTFRVEIEEVQEVVVNSPTELTFRLATPVAGQFYDLLAFGETFVLKPDADNSTAPVGAGPFRVESIGADLSVRLVKNERYWNAEDIRLAAVEFLSVGEGPPQVNALRSRAVDGSPVDPASVASVGDGLETVVIPSDSSFLWFPICKTAAPFDDVRVRQALNYALDRAAIAEALTEGQGEAMQGFWTSGSRFFNPDLAEAYPHDPARARQLLEEAGQSGLSFEAFTLEGPQLQRFAEIAQQQWAEAGITVTLSQSPNIVEDYFTGNKAPLAAIPLNRSGLDKVTRNLVPGSIGNVCTYDDPELNALVNQIRAVDQGGEEAVALWHDLQQLVFDKALAVFGFFTTQAYAWHESVGGVEMVPDVFGRIQLDVTRAYIRA